MDNVITHQENSNGAQTFLALGQFLHAEGWEPEQIENAPIYRMVFASESGPITCYAQVRMEEEIFLFYTVAPIRAPEAMRPAVAEFITRANYGLWVGNFEMDWEDGEVRYKSSLDFEGASLTPTLIRNTISPAAQMLTCYLPGLKSVIEGKLPSAALTEVAADCNCGC